MKTSEDREAKERSKEREETELHHHHHLARARLVESVSQSFVGTAAKREIDSLLCCPPESHEHGIKSDFLIPVAVNMGVDATMLAEWLQYMNDVGWKFYDDRRIDHRNYRRSLRMWREMSVRVAEDKRRDDARGGVVGYLNRIDKLREDGLKRQRQAAQSRRESASVKPESWELCRERCAMYNGGDDARCGFCRAGFRTPPQLRERPCPPEECPRFAALDGEVVA